MLTQLFRYRFSGSGELDGHSFKIYLSALAEITGSFEEAIADRAGFFQSAARFSFDTP
jgi:2-phospho-L-lactate transferase/gluconeogenesis factor (CofD/UPF0052 family)